MSRPAPVFGGVTQGRGVRPERRLLARFGGDPRARLHDADHLRCRKEVVTPDEYKEIDYSEVSVARIANSVVVRRLE